MEHYVKGANVERTEEEEEEVFDPAVLAADAVVRVRVRPGTKMRNAVGFAVKSLQFEDSEEFGKSVSVVLSGSGAALNKVISCAEIVRRKFPDAAQRNRLTARVVEERWDPKEDAPEGMDPIKVVREIPAMHIALVRRRPQPEQQQQQHQRQTLAEFLGCDAAAKTASASGKRRRNNNNNGGHSRGKRAAEELGMAPKGGGGRSHKPAAKPKSPS